MATPGNWRQQRGAAIASTAACLAFPGVKRRSSGSQLEARGSAERGVGDSHLYVSLRATPVADETGLAERVAPVNRLFYEIDRRITSKARFPHL